MKALLATLSLFMTVTAFADSVNFSVKPFKGELKSEEPGVKVVSINLLGRNQFCNFWGTTCAGGPGEEKIAPVEFKFDNRTNLIKFSTTGLNIKSSKLSNRFSSCKLFLKIVGEENGKNVYSSLELIFENRKATCEDPAAIAEELAEKFKVPASIKFVPYNW